MEAMFHGLTTTTGVLLVVSLLIAFGFEFVNGFHDTANAVATVIYTRSLRPWTAVILSGICNFLGVFVGGLAVALSIIHLLPIELLVSSGVGLGLAMILSLLLAATLWNLGTWYFGLPSSSSHTMIGAILGVGIANSMLPGHEFGAGVNWAKVSDVGMALLLSPLIGFTLAALLLLAAKRLIRDPQLYRAPLGSRPPPPWIRGILIFTCTGVSFAHGSNDGQKGVGLVMLILMGIVPAGFAINLALSEPQMREASAAVVTIHDALGSAATSAPDVRAKLDEVEDELQSLKATLGTAVRPEQVPAEQRFAVRRDVLLIDSTLKKLDQSGALVLPKEQAKQVKEARADLRELTDYAPNWVLFCVALSLGIGTMVGWKRIVVTVGEKIGKEHLTYAQGASAELVAMSTIGISAGLGLPVSTTHVLSSGVAGTMVAQRAGLQAATVLKIASAWVLTLPASMLLAGVLFLVFRAMLC
ncbi:inorganic phosphate transporter [Nannocystis sp. ILAH1]|uniref:inorganic phosphate transporter n=1 Tax=Nannocystis sp. ILAH1 TaxID=2996789 RepID=UPI00226EB25C|nr:inorganic phosphate transporter [Nannocystis sp. ILAH1]MCY0994725.1 inorganic phosphate transporter [Nannocystis sp. ILAH1]